MIRWWRYWRARRKELREARKAVEEAMRGLVVCYYCGVVREQDCRFPSDPLAHGIGPIG